jgi:hypothetical protein
MMQAIEDLYQTDAVEPDQEADVIRITAVCRRLTEPDDLAIPKAVSSVDGDLASPDQACLTSDAREALDQ